MTGAKNNLCFPQKFVKNRQKLEKCRNQSKQKSCADNHTAVRTTWEIMVFRAPEIFGLSLLASSKGTIHGISPALDKKGR